MCIRDRFKNIIHEIVSDAKQVGRAVSCVVLDLESVLSVDATGLTTLQELNALLGQQKVTLLLAGLQSQVFKFITLAGIAPEFTQHLHLGTPVDAVVRAALDMAAQHTTQPVHSDLVHGEEEAKAAQEPNPVGLPAEQCKEDTQPQQEEGHMDRL
eukprot:TRINITY_DN8953_c0_g1_i1.p1 TRINITY_DN8953_c0_g1~~TRINITY_DN8953_c0_g1_i1.p1  ORF type:complete len:155 (-),score=68.82 TRINITY_DN8953_c0_g1_i1:69-533(-)